MLNKAIIPYKDKFKFKQFYNKRYAISISIFNLYALALYKIYDFKD